MKSSLGTAGFISSYTSTSYSVTERSQSKYSSQGTWRKELSKGPRRNAMACFSWLLFTVQDHLSRGDTAHTELGPSILDTNQENGLEACPQANLLGTFS